MESVFEVDDVHSVGRWALKGHITDEFFLESLRAVGQILAGLQLSGGIIDLTDVTQFDVSEETLKQLAATSPVMAREMLRLVVAPEHQAFARARMFAMLSEVSRPNLFVVRSKEAAYHILGVKKPQFRRLCG